MQRGKIEFDPSQIWLLRSHANSFAVEVKQSYWDSLEKIIKNCWNVYVYFYPEFKVFDKINLESDLNIDFHGGVTYQAFNHMQRKTHKPEDENLHIVSKCFGCDYVHLLHDDRFCTYSTKDQAGEVFRDARNIFDKIEANPEGVLQ